MLVHPAPLAYTFIAPTLPPASDDRGSGVEGSDGGSGVKPRRPLRSVTSPPVMPAQSPLSIRVASDVVVLRSGASADQGLPAVLSGTVVLRLDEQASVKDIRLGFNGKARTAFTESVPPFKSHHLDEDIFSQDFSVLPKFTSGPSPSTGTSHTLSPGEHTFPFSLDLPPELPASIQATCGSIDYRVKATVVRPGFATQNWTAKRLIHVHHGLLADSMEYSSSLDIENDWPGKVSYAFTLSAKAHAVGATIPIHVKFVPHAKGVRVTALTTVVRESSTFYSKHHSANIARDVVMIRHDMTGFPGDSSPGVAPVDFRPPVGALSSSVPNAHFNSPPPDGRSNLSSSGRNSPRHLADGSHQGLSAGELSRRLANVSLASSGPNASAGERGENQSHDINTIIRIPIPTNAPPSHARTPIVVTHRIKWSALIQNPDGHTSELRCALPLHLLACDLQDEARLAASGATNLLFGPDGVLLPTNDQVAQVQLPSYPDHVRDRVANARGAPYFPANGGYVPTAWANSSRSSPAQTPTETPSPSRPASPSQGLATQTSRNPHGVPSSGSLSGMGRQDPIDWADGGLRDTLTPASSPPLATSDRPPQHETAATRTSRANSESERPLTTSQSGSRFHLSLPKSLRSFSSLSPALRTSHDRLSAQSSMSTSPTGAAAGPQTAPLAPVSSRMSASSDADTEDEALMMATPRRGTHAQLPPTTRQDHDQFASVPACNPHAERASDLGLDVLGQVPSYEVAEHWLGGGVVPLESTRGLPGYDA